MSLDEWNRILTTESCLFDVSRSRITFTLHVRVYMKMKNSLTVYQTGVSKHLHYSCQALTLKSCVSPCTAYNCMCPALPLNTMASDRGSYSMSAGNGLAWDVGRMADYILPNVSIRSQHLDIKSCSDIHKKYITQLFRLLGIV